MRYSGLIGYAMEVEGPPGVWKNSVVERKVSGDVLSPGSSFSSNGQQLNDMQLTQRISVIADEFAYTNFTNIVYITFMGHKWTISSIQIAKPRLIMSLGGIYVGN